MQNNYTWLKLELTNYLLSSPGFCLHILDSGYMEPEWVSPMTGHRPHKYWLSNVPHVYLESSNIGVSWASLFSMKSLTSSVSNLSHRNLFSHFWRPEVQNQGFHSVSRLCGLWGSISSKLLSWILMVASHPWGYLDGRCINLASDCLHMSFLSVSCFTGPFIRVPTVGFRANPSLICPHLD